MKSVAERKNDTKVVRKITLKVLNARLSFDLIASVMQ